MKWVSRVRDFLFGSFPPKIFVVHDGRPYEPEDINVFNSFSAAESFCESETRKRNAELQEFMIRTGHIAHPWEKKDPKRWSNGLDYLEIEEVDLK